MPPTICSGNKRPARADIRHNSRRPHHSLSNSINDGANHRSSEPKHFGGLGSLQKIVGEENAQYRQFLVDMSDNAVTSTTHMEGSQSEAESLDGCTLGRGEYVSSDSSHYSSSNRGPPFLLWGKRKRPHLYPAGIDDDEISMYDSFESTRDADEEHSSNVTDSVDLNCESISITSSDTEKSARLKRGNNQPLVRDKLLGKHRNCAKALNNLRNTEGLLSIAIKTIKLVRRNQMLQQRLTQLQLETSEFIQSVLANPENKHFRTNIQQNVREVENV